ncbi:hypothetical protein BFS13_10310 [Pantoea sp. Ae16]|nr:hypothetical protein BFS13_10310 [Pantoea sp. Ae16]
MALAAVSAVTDVWLPQRQGEDIDVTGVVIIMTIITLSGVLRFWQEFRTNRAAQSLKSMVGITTTVLRRASDNVSPVQTLLPVEELVPGDVIVLSAGDLVPADFRLLEARDLFVSQSILSRESLPVEKADVVADGRPRLHDHTPPPERKADLLELNTICLMGTNVTSGCALAVVVATGKHTWSGTLAKSLVGTL